MFVIGIDPHKGSHSAAVLDEHEELVGEVRVRAGRSPTRASWSSSRHGSNRGVGRSKARRARARCWRSNSSPSGETVLDVPPTLSARARLLDAARIDKTDAHDARSAAVVALRHSKLRTVVLEDHTAVLRLLAKRHHDLVAHRTRAICRLHTVLCLLVAGGLPRRLSAARAAAELRRIRPARLRSGSNVDDSPSSSSPRSALRTGTSPRSRPASPPRSPRRRRRSSKCSASDRCMRRISHRLQR